MITLGFSQKGGGRARRAHAQVDLFLRMCEEVALFMKENSGKEFKAFISRDQGSFRLYLVTTAEAYDFDLSRKLAEFAAPYVERGLLDSVGLLPAASPEELEAFFDPKTALRVGIDHA